MCCPKCGKETIIIDHPDSIEYHNEDTEWGIRPDHDTNDPGWLVAKPKTKPAALCGE